MTLINCPVLKKKNMFHNSARFTCIHRLYLVFLLVILICPLPTVLQAALSIPIEMPRTIIADVPFDIEGSKIIATGTPYILTIIQKDRGVLQKSGIWPIKTTRLTLDEHGVFKIRLEADDIEWTAEEKALPGFITILPPLLAILMALLFRQVVVALFAGIWLGSFIITDFNIIRSFYYVLDHYVIDSLSGSNGADHVSIAIFTLLLGGMVGIFSRMGGTQGIVNKISRLATNPRRGQIATWLMGIFIFFDDYTNTLVVGNTMRPLTDKLRISREKLSYIVDSTAAPVACIAVITSWIGFEISLIKDAFDMMGMDRNPFTTFISSIPYSFYPILTLAFGLLIAMSRRDFGPMLKAERRARTTGKVLSDKAVPISNIDTELSAAENIPTRWFNAVIPIGIVVAGTVIGLIITGRSSLAGSGTTGYSLTDVFREGNSFVALLWSSLTGCAAAIILASVQRVLSLTETMNAWLSGIKSMLPAIIILVLAWCIGTVCSDLHTADYLVYKIAGIIEPFSLPSLIFISAAAISFSTGTSWGTMTILTPITIPLAVKILDINAVSAVSANSILLSSIASILGGSVFGDHCSPISDTTIMSSMASAADHVDHVRTQLPYALVVAGISIVAGCMPSAFGFPPAASLSLSGILLITVVFTFGKKDIVYGP